MEGMVLVGMGIGIRMLVVEVMEVIIHTTTIQTHHPYTDTQTNITTVTNTIITHQMRPVPVDKTMKPYPNCDKSSNASSYN